jgi:hypothetical protein
MMPHKFNASRRHKFEKKRQKVTNWLSTMKVCGGAVT